MDQDPMVVGPANGEVRGVSNDMPNRGTGSGFVNKGEPYGADVGVNATNSQGSFNADSDPIDKEWNRDDRQTMSGHQHNGGRSMGNAAKSDAMDDTTPGDEGLAGDRD